MKGLSSGPFYISPMMEGLYAVFRESAGICTDTRKVRPRDLFFALKGPNFNANDFAFKALEEGCHYAVVDEDRPEFRSDSRFIIVNDALETLQSLARYHRRKLKIPVIGLTGSNGKTTTKELIRAAVSEQYQCYATQGNLNNHIGVPLSILEITGEHEIAIIEMGANHQKEITLLCNIAEPDYGLITNIGLAHLEGFGGEEGVYKGKKELFDFIRAHGGRIFINVDDPKVVAASEGTEGITYGSTPKAHYQGDAHMENGKLVVRWWRDNQPSNPFIIHTQLSGIYNFSNVLSAIAIARYFGVPEQKIRHGIEQYYPANQRSQIVVSNRQNTLIVDCYNANPSSMKAALENVAAQKAERKVLILGDMFELGEQSETKHAELLENLREMNIHKALLVGEVFSSLGFDNDHITSFKTTEQAAAFLQANSIQDSLVLLKGSRKMKLESLLPFL